MRARRAATRDAGVILALAGGLLLPAPAAARPCTLHPLSITGSRATRGPLTVTLDQPDAATRPDAWIGPLRIRVGPARACRTGATVSIVTRPLWLGNRTLFVTTYSGSEYRLYGVDVATCRTTWASAPIAGAVRVAGGKLVRGGQRVALRPDCTPAHPLP